MSQAVETETIPPHIDKAKVQRRSQSYADDNGSQSVFMAVEPGTRVHAGDRGNVGTVVSDKGNFCDVHFVSDDGNTATKELPKTQLKFLDGTALAKPLGKKIKPIPFGELVANYSTLREPVISGILRRGETANIIAAAKIGKSFLAGNLAMSVATGCQWLGNDVAQGRVLVIDNELHPETLSHRLFRIATDMMVDAGDIGDSIDVVPMRGLNVDIHGVEDQLEAINPGHYTLCVIDALYRTIPEGVSENDNAAMMGIYNRLDYYASRWNCAIAVVHHSSKGFQGDKSVTDVGSGAGAISRAADTHIAIRPHEEPGLAVFECVTRSFKSPDPFSIKFEWPLWSAVSNRPEVRKPGRQNAEAQERADTEDSQAILAKIPASSADIQQARLAEMFDFGESKFRRLMGKLCRAGLVEIERKRPESGGRETVFYRRAVNE